MNKIKKFIRSLLPPNIRAAYVLRNIYKSDKSEWIVSKDHDLCITGYPRSGNTFIWIYFKIFQKQIKLSHHIHNKELFLYSLYLKKPTVVLIRDPFDAISSYILFLEGLGKAVDYTKQIDYYIDYYSELKKVNKDDNILIIDFELVKNDFLSFLQIISRKFVLDLNEINNYETIKKQVYSEIKKVNNDMWEGNKMTLHTPTKMKESSKREILNKFNRKKYILKINKCKELYKDLK